MERFGDTLNRIMMSKGIRATDLTRLTGIPKSCISYYINNKAQPKDDRFSLICQALGVSEEMFKNSYSGGYHLINTRLYRIWHGMKQRCQYPNSIGYKYYGAKGVTVCAEWTESFVKFRDWAMAHGYRDDLTLDRIDPYGNYEPANCRWATYKEQAANKRAKA